MNEDFSEIFNKFSNILKEKNIDLNNIINNSNVTESTDSSVDSDFSIDIDTILKIKELITAINQNNNSPRNKLLHSLRPYLEENKKQKLEQYIKIANLLTALESINGLEFENNFNYDFILVVILFLLII